MPASCKVSAGVQNDSGSWALIHTFMRPPHLHPTLLSSLPSPASPPLSIVHTPRPGRQECPGDGGQCDEDRRLWPSSRHSPHRLLQKDNQCKCYKATRCMSSAQDSAGQVFSHLDFSAVTQYRLLCLRNSAVGCAEYAHSFPSPALHVPSLPLCCPAWGHPQCPVLFAGPTAC